MSDVITLPKPFSRTSARPIDRESLFPTYADLLTYTSSPIAYPGQVVAVSGTNSVYVINNDYGLTLLGAASAISTIESQFLPLSGGYVTDTLGANLLSSQGGTSNQWNSNYNTTALLSAKWNSVHNNVAVLSSVWNSNHTTTAAASARWNSVHANVAALSSTWNSVHANVAVLSSVWNSTHANVATLSSVWNSVHANVAVLSSVWNSTHANVAVLSSVWNSNHTTTAAASARWNSVHANVAALSSVWNSTHSTVAAVSARWNSVHNNVAVLSSVWNSTHSTVAAASARWNSVHNSVASVSANWNEAYNASTIYNVNSALYTPITLTDTTYLALTGGTLTGDLNIQGHLYVAGSATFVNTQDIIVTDPIIFLGDDNASDALDEGFMVSWTEAPLGLQHGGLLRRAETGEWTLFGGMTSVPLEDANPDWDEPEIYQALLNADLRGTVFGNLTGSARDANILTTARVISAKKDIDFSVTFNGSQNVTGDATIANHAVTLDKIQEISTDRLLGRGTAGTGDVEQITCTAQARELLDDSTAADQATTIGVGTTNTVAFSAITIGSPAVANNRVFTKTTQTTTNILNVPTFPKTGFNTVKYTVQIKKNTTLRAALEILATNSDGDWEGTVYAIVDPDNIFTNVDVSTLQSTVDLDFTFNGNATYNVVVLGNALNE